MKQRHNISVKETGGPSEKLLTNGTIHHVFRMRKFCCDPARNYIRLALKIRLGNITKYSKIHEILPCNIKPLLTSSDRNIIDFSNVQHSSHLKSTSVYFASNIIMALMRKMCGLKVAIRTTLKANNCQGADVERALQNRQIRVCAFNLQSVLHTACCNLSVFYCKMRLNCYFWNEASGNNVAIKHASCVYVYIKSTDCNDMPIIFCSDNCYSQNKNKF
ncbi:hypothetical protein PR048_009122 [Dryococelus australis]|uniref:Uncharacterized protein n=1 Tax=Dryococelus australis TaxID=614101 RepID=A0ABQ9HZ03_9NEOP|nr:hypothetical protein PR048_009122 [Dryococelus australis]